MKNRKCSFSFRGIKVISNASGASLALCSEQIKMYERTFVGYGDRNGTSNALTAN